MELTKIRTYHQDFQGYKVILASSNTPFLALAYSLNKQIYVSELFMEIYTKEEQEAILAHEVGHLTLHSHEKSTERVLFHELEADRFGAEIVGFQQMASAIKKSVAFAKRRYQEGLSDSEKFRKQQVEFSHRISNLLDYMKGKTTTLEFARKSLS